MKNLFFSILVLMSTGLIYGQEIQKCPDNKVTITKTDVSCFSGNDGKIIISLSAPEVRVFQLVNNTENKIVRDFTTDKVFGFLTSGSYRVICKDTSNSLCYTDITLKQPDELKFTIDQIITSNKPNKDKSDGSMTVNFTGGTQPYTLYINNSDKTYIDTFKLGNLSNKIIDKLSSGIYTIIIKDNNDCQTKGIQYELIAKDNFGFSFQKKPKTCKNNAEYKILIKDGQSPFLVNVNLNGSPSFSQSYQTLSEFIVQLSDFGIYDVTIQDKRNLPIHFPFNYEDVDCKLKVITNQISQPNLDNPTNGKIQIQIQNGASPYSVKCIDNLTRLPLSETKSENRNQEFSNLKEGIYTITVEDTYGRTFDTLISITTKIISGDDAMKEFKKNKNDLLGQLYTCECNKDRVENSQKGIRVTIAVVGLAGTIASAGVGTLVGGIISGVVTTGGMLTNEYAPDKKIDILKSNFLKLKEIEILYNKYSVTNFDKANWNTQKVKEYEEFKKRIADELSQLNKDFTPTCKDKKLKEKYNWVRPTSQQ
jgi:hypothetical protein